MRRIFLTVQFLLLLLPISSWSQISSTIKLHGDSIEIGDPIVADIFIKIPNNIELKGIDFAAYLQIGNLLYSSDTLFLDKYADIEILDFGKWKNATINQLITSKNEDFSIENGQKVISNTIKLTIYNAGIYQFYGPNVITEPASNILPTEGPKLIVTLPKTMMQQDSMALNPIKDIMLESANWTDYMIYFYLLGGILVTAGLGYYLYKIKNKIKEEVTVDVPEIILPAHEKALNALKHLDSLALWQHGQIKEYQTQLTSIIRTYLEDRFGIKAIEMTTDEITQSLKKVDFDPSNAKDLQEILQIADLVKFAKAKPSEDIHSSFMVKAIDLVLRTKNNSSHDQVSDPL